MKTYGCWWVPVVSLKIIHQIVQLTIPDKCPLLSTKRPSLLSLRSPIHQLQPGISESSHIYWSHMTDWLIKHQSFIYSTSTYKGLILGARNEKWMTYGLCPLGTQSEERRLTYQQVSCVSGAFWGPEEEAIGSVPRTEQRPYNRGVMWPRSWEMIFFQLEKAWKNILKL